MTIFFATYTAENYRDAMPPFSYHMRSAVEGWPWPFPPFIRLTIWGHLQMDKMVDTTQRVHMGVRDRIALPAARAVGVPESTVTRFRERHIQVTDTVYGRIRNVHWYA